MLAKWRFVVGWTIVLELESRLCGLLAEGSGGGKPVGVDAFEVDEDFGVAVGDGSWSSMLLKSGTSANML